MHICSWCISATSLHCKHIWRGSQLILSNSHVLMRHIFIESPYLDVCSDYQNRTACRNCDAKVQDHNYTCLLEMVATHYEMAIFRTLRKLTKSRLRRRETDMSDQPYNFQIHAFSRCGTLHFQKRTLRTHERHIALTGAHSPNAHSQVNQLEMSSG